MPPPASRNALLSLAATTSRRPPRLLPPAARFSSSSSSPEPRTPPAYRYHAAASVSAKTDPLDLARNTYSHRHALARKPWPPRGGHDAFFLSDAPEAGSADGGGGGGAALALGVADGVGGWVDSGVNPADFSRRLCRNMARAAAAGCCPRPRARGGGGRVGRPGTDGAAEAAAAPRRAARGRLRARPRRPGRLGGRQHGVRGDGVAGRRG